MTKSAHPERETQNRIVTFFQKELGYEYLGNLEESEKNNFYIAGNYSAPKIPGIKQEFQQRQVLQLQRRLLHVFLLSPYKNGF